VVVSTNYQLVLNIVNVAIDHKKTCSHECNVVIGDLRRAANLLLGFLVPDLTRAEILSLREAIDSMPKY